MHYLVLRLAKWRSYLLNQRVRLNYFSLTYDTFGDSVTSYLLEHLRNYPETKVSSSIPTFVWGACGVLTPSYESDTIIFLTLRPFHRSYPHRSTPNTLAARAGTCFSIYLIKEMSPPGFDPAPLDLSGPKASSLPLGHEALYVLCSLSPGDVLLLFKAIGLGNFLGSLLVSMAMVA